MTKYLILLVAIASTLNSFAQQPPEEIENCYAFDVPPLIPIGNAPAKRVYSQYSILKTKDTNQIVNKMVKIITPVTDIGIALYAANTCEMTSDSTNCTSPFVGNGDVQINTSSKKISFQHMKLKLEKSSNPLLLGSVKNLDLTEITCEELKKIIGL